MGTGTYLSPHVRITHPDGAQFDYAYDGLNRPTTLTDPALALTHLYEPWGTVSAIVRSGAGSGRWTPPDGRLRLSPILLPAGAPAHRIADRGIGAGRADRLGAAVGGRDQGVEDQAAL
jgi:YD repeat-containing protein